ncbi:hypothetical protein Y032_0316g2290 [Ancylostoma ceylanicum]|uniref:Uncharacterized protein n=2 Tax=Ancylostoma ceylanicum TaxID=53326 RepID=A0A016S1B8_9BILA|nr:hypothetical protein Y032_0316g2290 [Ancylostoma ceylanicum]
MTISSFDMLLVLLGATLIASGFSYECDVGSFPESQRELGRRVCRLEKIWQDLLGSRIEYGRLVDVVLNSDEPTLEKRKNEFIRFGKRSLK